MQSIGRKIVAWVVMVSFVAGPLGGCVDFAASSDSLGSKTNAANYSSGYEAPAPLPAFTYQAPAAPAFSSLLDDAYAPPSAPDDTAVGQIPGTSNVDQDGAYNYTVPIELPAGVSGMTPNLAISYNSRAGDGPLGVGFSLAGLSKIERCKKVLAVEEKVQQVQFTSGQDGDAFCLDGKKLMLTGGTQGVPGSTYRTELADYSEIKLQNVDGVPYFIIYSRDGTVRWLYPQTNLKRYTPGSTSQPVSAGLTWYLTRIADHFGNDIFIDYDVFLNAQGVTTELLPERIRYAGDTREVNFTYDSSGAGHVEKCAAGVCTAHPPVLEKIEIALNSATGRSGAEWEYELEYDESPTSKRKRLVALRWCEADGECLPATEFEWKDNSTLAYRGVWLSEPVGYSINISPTARLTDFDGDGRADLLYSGRNTSLPPPQVGCFSGSGEHKAYVRLSQGLSVDSEQYAEFDDPIDVSQTFLGDGKYAGVAPRYSRTADFDNDGADEMLAWKAEFFPNAGGEFYYVEWSKTQNKFVTAPSGSPWNFTGGPFKRLDVADMDGNGLPDIHLEQTSPSLQRRAYLVQPSGVGTASLSAQPPVSNAACMGQLDRGAWDIDGDGRHSFGCQPGGLIGVGSSGTVGTTPMDDPVLLPPGLGAGDYVSQLFGDVNGDGLPDRILASTTQTYVSVEINTGHGFLPAYQAIADEDVLFLAEKGLFQEDGVTLGDFNGDGRIDVLIQGGPYQQAVGGDGPCSGAIGYPNTVPPHILLSDGATFRLWVREVPGFDPLSIFDFYGSGTLAPENRVRAGATAGTEKGFPSTAVGDVDGDGKAEILLLGYSENSGDTRFFLYTQTADDGGDRVPAESGSDLLVTVQNERWTNDSKERIRYGAMSRADDGENDTYVPAETCQWPQRCLKEGLTVVRSYSGQASGFRTWDYRYEDARSGRAYCGSSRAQRRQDVLPQHERS